MQSGKLKPVIDRTYNSCVILLRSLIWKKVTLEEKS